MTAWICIEKDSRLYKTVTNQDFIIAKSREDWYKNFMQKVGFVLLLFLPSSCASPVISKEMRGRASDLPFEAVNKNPGLYEGTVLIWGGRILSAKQTEGSCMVEVLKMPLDSRLVVKEEEESQESFFAFIPGCTDPLLCRKGRLITVAGKLEMVQGDTRENKEVYHFLISKEIYFHKRPLKYKPPEKQITKEATLRLLLEIILRGMAMAAPF